MQRGREINLKSALTMAQGTHGGPVVGPCPATFSSAQEIFGFGAQRGEGPAPADKITADDSAEMWRRPFDTKKASPSPESFIVVHSISKHVCIKWHSALLRAAAHQESLGTPSPCPLAPSGPSAGNGRYGRRGIYPIHRTIQTLDYCAPTGSDNGPRVIQGPI